MSPNDGERRTGTTGRQLRRFLLLGQILGPHALDGEVRVKVMTDRDGGLGSVTDCWILEDANGKNPEPTRILATRGAGDDLVTLIGIETREHAEKLKHHYLAVDREGAYAPEEDRWFVADLIGCRVFDAVRGEIGTVRDVLSGTSNDNYVIRRPNGQQDLLFPALKAHIQRIDIALGEIHITLPEGLWEIYED